MPAHRMLVLMLTTMPLCFSGICASTPTTPLSRPWIPPGSSTPTLAFPQGPGVTGPDPAGLQLIVLATQSDLSTHSVTLERSFPSLSLSFPI